MYNTLKDFSTNQELPLQNPNFWAAIVLLQKRRKTTLKIF